MAFDHEEFPQEIGRNSIGGPGFKTDIVEIDSGAEERVSRWAGGRHAWDIRLTGQFDDHYVTKEFYMARNGAARGFLFHDPVDHASTANGRSEPTAPAFNDIDIAIGDGSTIQFQLIKHYTSGALTHTRLIEKPKAGTVLVGLDNVEQTTGWTVNTTTGIITFTTAPAVGVVVQAGFEFHVPVRFGAEADEAIRMNMLGADAGEFTDVPIIEIKNERAVREELPAGGLVQETLTASRQITPAEAKVYLFTTSSSSFDIILPNPNGMGTGKYFEITNESASSAAISVNDDTGALVAAIAIGAMKRFGVVTGVINGEVFQTWIAWG